MKLKTIKYFCEDPGRIVGTLGAKGLLNWMPDRAYLKLMFRLNLGCWPDFDNPRTFNEKLNWLKLHDRKPEYTRMVDKYAVREYIAERIGEQYLIPLVGGPWNSVEEIDFDALPDKFVLKSTHDSGGVVICRDKASFDIEAAKRKLDLHLRREYFWGKREWPYKNVKPRIIAEQYMQDSPDGELRDYKFFAFYGKVRALFIASERYNADTETRFDFFDDKFVHMDLRNGHPNADNVPQKPENFEEMMKLASILSEGIPQLRVDFYQVCGKTYFGELTFTHWGGFVPFDPPEWDEIFGGWIELPEITE